MNIEKNVNGAVTTLKIIGRLDTTTAPALEATIDGCITGVQELILDCTALEYVSSAGLRVLLKSQKQMNAQGSMNLINVSEDVMDILEMTGFADILVIK